jgi:hypothetical protein
VLDLEVEKGEWGFKALKQMIKINFKLVGFVYFSLYFLLSADLLPEQLRGDDESLQATVDVHKERRHQKSLGKVHQFHPGLHIHFQKRECFTRISQAIQPCFAIIKLSFTFKF